MVGARLAVATLAFVGWIGSIASQLVVALTGSETERIEWSERRAQFLLLASLATNALVVDAAYRFVEQRRRDR